LLPCPAQLDPEDPMFRLISRLAGLLLLSSPVLAQDEHKGHAHGDHAQAPAAAPQVLTGEVMDLACYLQHPESGQGPDHAACAAQCINKGLPAGLKVGTKLYLLVGKGHDSITDKLAPLAGKQAKITGQVLETEGLPAIIVHEAAAATP
jgi:hypothetical protein